MSLLHDKLRQLQVYQLKGRPTAPLDTDQKDYPVCICQNCGTEFRGNYCPQCGQRSDTRRINMRTAIEHALGIFTNLDRGFMRTCTELCSRPGYMIRDYLNGHRASYSKPLSLLFVLATIQFVVHYLFFRSSSVISGFSGDLSEEEAGNESLMQFLDMLRSVFEYLNANHAVLTLITILFLVLPNWLCFKMTTYGRRLNIAEHFYIMLFIGCQLMLINILEIPYDQFVGKEDDVFVFGSGVAFLASVWDYKQLFRIGWWRTIGIYILSYTLALILFVIVIILFFVFYFTVWHPEAQEIIHFYNEG